MSTIVGTDIGMTRVTYAFCYESPVEAVAAEMTLRMSNRHIVRNPRQLTFDFDESTENGKKK